MQPGGVSRRPLGRLAFGSSGRTSPLPYLHQELRARRSAGRVGADGGMAAAVEPKDVRPGGARGLVVVLQKSTLAVSMLVAVAQNASPSIAV